MAFPFIKIYQTEKNVFCVRVRYAKHHKNQHAVLMSIVMKRKIKKYSHLTSYVYEQF